MPLSKNHLLIFAIILSGACSAIDREPTVAPAASPLSTGTSVPGTENPTIEAGPTLPGKPTPTPTSNLPPTTPVTATPRPSVESLEAKVTAGLLSCRYGPGPDYLYLFAFRQNAEIRLVGRVDADNWNWVWVENETRCWVNAKFLQVEGEIRDLPIVYPGQAKLPITPYYPPSAVLSAERTETDKVNLSWVHVPISPGDFEDETMQTYIVEVWRCLGGELIFEPVATSLAFLTVIDEPGCAEPSHGRVFVQEKHGYAGPAEIPWPEHK